MLKVRYSEVKIFCFNHLSRLCSGMTVTSFNTDPIDEKFLRRLDYLNSTIEQYKLFKNIYKVEGFESK